MNNLTITPLSPDSNDSQIAEQLYLTAFPEIERHPIDELYEGIESGHCQWFIVKEKKNFIGMAYMIFYAKIAYLLYFAVLPDKRNANYGSEILKCLKNKYEDKSIVLLIESLNEQCDNREMRLRRKNFYLRNGLIDSGLIQETLVDGVVSKYELLSTNPNFDADDFRDFSLHFPFTTYMTNLYTNA